MNEMHTVALNLVRQENAQQNDRRPRHYTRNIWIHAFLQPDSIFINNFRLTEDLVMYLRNLLTPFMIEPTRKSILDIPRLK